MFFISKSKYALLEGENEELNKTIKKLSNQKLLLETKLDVLVKEIKKQDQEIKHLSKFKDKYVKSATSRGGLIRFRNKILKQNTLLEEENRNYIKKIKKEEKISRLKDTTISELCDKNKELSNQISKLQEIVTNLNDLITKKMRPKPTVQDITNYDKKTPIKRG